MVPYSLYASGKAGRTVFLSTQSEALFQDGNNEKAWDSGGWEPGWRDDQNAFYNRSDIKHLNWPKKLSRFVWSHKAEIPQAVLNKLWEGYRRISWPFVLLLLVQYCFIRTRLGGRIQPLTDVLILVALLSSLLNKNLAFLLIINFMIFPFQLRKIKAFLIDNLTIGFLVIFFNYLILTVLLFGRSRFIGVFDGITMLVFLNLALVSAVIVVSEDLIRSKKGK